VRARSRLIVIGLALLVMVAGGFAALHVWHIRHDYGVVAWTPTGPTPRIPFQGRTYLLGTSTEAAVPAGAELLGSIAGGGKVYGNRMDCCVATTVFVRYPDGTIASYALSGGP
jgi:hypothetical protein